MWFSGIFEEHIYRIEVCHALASKSPRCRTRTLIRSSRFRIISFPRSPVAQHSTHPFAYNLPFLAITVTLLSPIQRPLLFRIVRITNSVSRRIELTHSLHLASRVYLTYIFRCGQLSHSWFGKGASPVSAINEMRCWGSFLCLSHHVIYFEWERDGSYIGSSECFVRHPKWNDEFSRIEQAEQANKPPENALTSWYRNVDETGCVLGICNWSEKYDFDFIQVCF